jgi:cysteine desulfurase
LSNKRVYLDYASTTPLDPGVLQKMLPFFREDFGNPSSIHSWGQRAEGAIEAARVKIAGRLNAKPGEIIFTGCGTESDNLAIRGTAFAEQASRGANHILTTLVEHHAVLHTVQQLKEYFGFDVEYLPVDRFGMVDPLEVKKRITPQTALVSVIYANNEIGTINPVAEIGSVCREAGVAFHTDAVQAAAHLEIDVQKDAIDLLTIGAHKFYGPKGVGVLYLRNGLRLMPAQTGGSQESGLRAGTQNVPYIVGMAEALAASQDSIPDDEKKLLPLRDQIIGSVLANIPHSQLTGHPTERSANHASFVFEDADGNRLLMLLDQNGFACSSGSACKVCNPEPSEVLTSIGLSDNWALGSLRITLGKFTTQEEVDSFLAVLPPLVEKARRRA